MNARALMTCAPGAHKRKWAVAARLLSQTAITCIQETHGGMADLQLCAARASTTHSAYLNPGQPPAADGTMIFIRNDFDAGNASKHEITAPGRIHYITYRPSAMQRGLAVFNIHNYDISSSQITKMRRAIAQLCNAQHDVFLMGDFNFGGSETPTAHRGRRHDAAIPRHSRGGQVATHPRRSHRDLAQPTDARGDEANNTRRGDISQRHRQGIHFVVARDARPHPSNSSRRPNPLRPPHAHFRPG